MIVKPWIELGEGLVFLGYIKYWKNDLKLSIITDSAGYIDSMSQQLMINFEISNEFELEQARYNIQWLLSDIE